MPPGLKQKNALILRLTTRRYPNYSAEISQIVTEDESPDWEEVSDTALKQIVDTFGLDLVPREGRILEDALYVGDIAATYPARASRVKKALEDVRAYVRAAYQYEMELSDLSKERLRKLGDDLDGENAEYRLRDLAVEDEWRFFNFPRAAADFASWSKRKRWKPEEAVALSLSKDPNKVNPTTLAAALETADMSVFYREFQNRLTQLEMAIGAKELHAVLTPAKFVKWAGSEGWNLPSELADSLASARADGGESQKIYAPTLYAVLYALLCALQLAPGKAGTPPKASKDMTKMDMAKIVGELHATLSRAGTPIDQKTLRKHVPECLAWAEEKTSSELVQRAFAALQRRLNAGIPGGK